MPVRLFRRLRAWVMGKLHARERSFSDQVRIVVLYDDGRHLTAMASDPILHVVFPHFTRDWIFMRLRRHGLFRRRIEVEYLYETDDPPDRPVMVLRRFPLWVGKIMDSLPVPARVRRDPVGLVRFVLHHLAVQPKLFIPTGTTDDRLAQLAFAPYLMRYYPRRDRYEVVLSRPSREDPLLWQQSS